MKSGRIFLESQDADFSYIDEKGRRYRCNAMQTLNGPMAVFRIIADRIMTTDDLGLPECLNKVLEYKKGMVLVTGASGCGKSTTLATLVDMINSVDPGHILTVEDPVEIQHKSKKSLVNHREVHTHTKTFARALKSALREDPDCIMIGEMRDLETISLALTAAETGHLVFGTLHTASAAKTITRIIDVFPAGEQPQIRAMLSEAIQCVISQVLCKRKDGKGRVAVFEIMFGTPAIRNLIRMDKIHQIDSSISTGMSHGMQTLDQALMKMVKADIIDVEEAKHNARHPEDFA
jgi:twitching motility protein PilT